MIGLCLPVKALAHGAKIEYTVNVAIELVATYDNGEPMAGAQFVVYAPDDPSTPWLTGVCDDEGRFSFVPDTSKPCASKPCTWDVQVRQAGHGDFVHIPIGEDTLVTGSAGGYTTLQIVLMALCVVWGTVGTALYFSRRRRA
ncbi:MAG: carboxypeptidase regulatory-like domain-containing protein [Dehalococcoidia bacterium]|nr:MAG: carboxypeptidase regulatory-like domain-containing protein [Dehalococcoidia bacterium]